MRFPVSFAQQRLWFLEQLAPGEPTYNLPYGCWLEGPLDPGALQRAMDAMVARHAALRTSIVACDGVPEQVIADTGTVPIEHIELPPGLDEGERTRRAESIAADLARKPFDLATGPLIRMALIAAGPGRHLLVAGHAPQHQRRIVDEDPDRRAVRRLPGRDGRRARDAAATADGLR